MDIMNVLQLIAGLAFFLFGMNEMGVGLEKTSGGKLEQLLQKLTSNRFKGLLLGLVVTGIIQSSSATTVMVVGFVNSGIMKLSQAIGVIMGANIGTTVTAWILSLTSIQGESAIFQLFKPETFAAVFGLIGVIMIVFLKSDRKKHLGSILLNDPPKMVHRSTENHRREKGNPSRLWRFSASHQAGSLLRILNNSSPCIPSAGIPDDQPGGYPDTIGTIIGSVKHFKQ